MLAGATLSFDAPLSEFFNVEFDAFASRYALNRPLFTAPLTRLYASLRIVIPVEVVALESADDDNNGVVDRTSRSEHDALGRLTVPDGLLHLLSHSGD